MMADRSAFSYVAKATYACLLVGTTGVLGSVDLAVLRAPKKGERDKGS